jgi:hypothetical protein
MNKTSLVNGNLEYDTHTTAREFFEVIIKQDTLYGKNMNREAKHGPYHIANALIRLIKDGSVPNVEDALLYCMNKTGISFDMENDKKRIAWNNLLQNLKDYNGGDNTIPNGREKFTFIAENKALKFTNTGKNLLFFNADLHFDFYKNKKSGFYDHAILLDGDTPIRTYNKDTGEERSVRYEVLNGLSRVLTTSDKITYTPMDVRDSYVYHQDSGHGWLEVPAREIKAMGLEGRITPCSYLYQDKAYLEEDMDAGTFLDMRKLLPKPVSIQNNYIDGMCRIRDYPHYRPDNITSEKEKPARKTSRSKYVEWER